MKCAASDARWRHYLERGREVEPNRGRERSGSPQAQPERRGNSQTPCHRNQVVIRQPHCHPERSEGPMQVVMLSEARGTLALPNPIVILSGAKDLCNESC